MTIQNSPIQSISVIGAGAWGTALARLLALKGLKVCLLGLRTRISGDDPVNPRKFHFPSAFFASRFPPSDGRPRRISPRDRFDCACRSLTCDAGHRRAVAANIETARSCNHCDKRHSRRIIAIDVAKWWRNRYLFPGNLT